MNRRGFSPARAALSRATSPPLSAGRCPDKAQRAACGECAGVMDWRGFFPVALR
ncbi:hypothetical protein KIN65_19425 [Klebsiella michiganensis]|nr:hypothetical protein [Klebsiella michiganensis]